MARPIKKGLDYFPFDVDIFQDGKIRRLRSRYGNDGIIVYIYLLCDIYRTNGYYAEVDDEYLELAADDLNMSVNTIGQIVQYLLSRSLFDNTLFQSVTCLSSTGIQKRYQEAVKQRGKKNTITVEGKIWLLDKEDTRDFIKVTHEASLSAKNNSISGNNTDISNEKQHKEKESKVKESKVKNKESIGRTPAFSKPSIEEIKAYCIERNNSIDPERFYDYYESNGWMVGRGKMKDWRATVRNWERREKESRNDGRKKPEKKNPYLEMLRKEQMKNDKRGNNENDSNALIGISEPQ